MAFVRLLLMIGLIFICATALSTGEDTKNDSITVNSCFPDYVKPINYSIKLMPNIEGDYSTDVHASFKSYIEEQKYEIDNFVFYGESDIFVNITHATTNITINLLRPEINNEYEIKYNIRTVKPFTHFITDLTYVLKFENKLHPGTYLMQANFSGTVPNNIENFLRISYTNRRGKRGSLIVGNLHTNEIKHVFPCYDSNLEGISRLSFIISMKYHEPYKILSNILYERMPIKVDYQIVENDMVLTNVNAQTRRMYFMAIAVSDFVSFSSVNAELWYRLTLPKHLLNFAWDMIHFITTYVQYQLYRCTEQFPIVNHIVIPDFPEESKAVLGFALHRERDIIYDENSGLIARKIVVARSIASNMINKLFTHMPSELHEGFVMLEAYVIDKAFESQMMNLFVIQNQHEFLYWNDFIMNATLDKKSKIEKSKIDLYSSLFGSKLPFILRLLQHLLIDEMFEKSINRYLNSYVYGITTLNDLWATIESVLAETYPYESQFNLTERVNIWVKQKYHPAIMIMRNSSDSFYIDLEYFDIRTMNNCWIPVTYAKQANPHFNDTSLREILWLKQHSFYEFLQPTKYVSDPHIGDWVIANIQQVGSYRVRYDVANLEKIISYLKSPNYTKIHVLNRAQLIDDAFHLAIEKKLNFSTFWNLASYLSQETDYIAWYPMFKVLEQISSIFPLQHQTVEKIKNDMNKIFNGTLLRIRYEETSQDNDFIRLLRQEILKWACTLGHIGCLQTANLHLQQYLMNSKMYSILSWRKEWIYCKGMMTSDNATWTKVMNTWLSLKVRDRDILEFLACSQDPDIIIRYIQYPDIVSSNTKQQIYQYIHIFHSIIARHVRNNKILNFILMNFYKTRRGVIKPYIALIDIINHVYSEQQLYEISEYVKKQPISEEGSNLVQRKIAKRLLQIQRQIKYVRTFSK